MPHEKLPSNLDRGEARFRPAETAEAHEAFLRLTQEFQQARPELPRAACEALANAQLRREKEHADQVITPGELGGRREGLEPVRYGDWEKKGLAIDF